MCLDMFEGRRTSYSRPEATVKMLISACRLVTAEGDAAEGFDNPTNSFILLISE